MTPSRKIAAALDENTRAFTPPCSIAIDDGPVRLTLEIAALDSVGVALDALEYRDAERKEWTAEDLNAWGDRLRDRLTYLMEPVHVLEVDGGAGEVLLRSKTPSRRGEARNYYEIRLRRDGSCRVERFAFDDVERRRGRVPCQLTREVLERLADDLAASTR